VTSSLLFREVEMQLEQLGVEFVVPLPQLVQM
jgi:hypothetical protein